MSCEAAMIVKVISLSPDQTVEEGMQVLTKNIIRAAPVLDRDGRLLGMFSFRHTLIKLLPVSVTMKEGLENIDFAFGAAPGVAKRLRELKTRRLAEVVDGEVHTVFAKTPIWEGIRLLVKYGSPLPVIDEKSRKFLGILTEQSVLEELQKSAAELEAEVAREIADRQKDK